MINIKPLILQTLELVPGVNQVCYAWPDDFEDIPCITYKIEDNSVNTKTDKVEKLTNIRFQIDVWTISASDNSTLAGLVDAMFQEMGFERNLYNDFKDGAYVHGVMKYHGVIDSRNNLVYQ